VPIFLGFVLYQAVPDTYASILGLFADEAALR
jgi:hypothetical protein